VFLKLQPFLYSILFLIGLELITLKNNYVIIIAIFLFLISLYEGRRLGSKWRYSILPAFFTISSIALLYLITLPYEQQVFIVLATSMYYLSLFGAYRLGKYSGDQTARGMIMAATVATIFFFFTSSYGIYLNFLVPLYYLMLVYLVATLLVSYQYFALIHDKDLKKVWTYSFLIALTMVELIWTMNFWPFGYLTTGVIALILYYVLWDITQSHFLNCLNRKRVVANAVLFTFLICFILLSAKWIPVI
jgi:hypothetical protein